jgi:nucleoid-associated protein YgaU
MNQRSSAPARALAATALACGFVVVIVIVAASLGGGDGDGGGSGVERRGGQATTRSNDDGGRQAPKTYVVQSGDTLSSIARKTGVPVARIVALNPGVDPQILISGEKLKLR